MPSKKYDLIVVGSGPAGFAALAAAREAGAKRLAVVESYRRLGGECPNWGCMPTKSLLQTVDVLMHCSRGAEFGVPNCGGRTDFQAAKRRQRQIVDALTGGPRLARYVKDSGADLIRGRASFVGPNSLQVRGKTYSADKFVVACGTDFFAPPIPGLNKVKYLTARDILALERLPKSVLIIGGGPIGVEFSKIFSVFGVKATMVEASPHILPREDHDIARVVSESLRRMGVVSLAGSQVSEIRPVAGGIEADIAPMNAPDGSRPSGSVRPRRVRAAAVVVATGKRQIWSRIGAEAAGVKLTKRGAPVLNRFLQTSNKSIYAAGDAAGRSMFTTVAHAEGEAAAANAVMGNRRTVDLRVMPRGTYGDPEVGSVGLTEEQARAAGLKVSVGLAPFGVLSKAMVTGEPLGLVKLVCDRRSGQVIGGHVVGHSAAEIVHAIAVAMRGRLTCRDLGEMIYAFPTYSEAIKVAALNVG